MNTDTLIITGLITLVVYFTTLFLIIREATASNKRDRQMLAIIKLLTVLAMKEGVSSEMLTKIVGSKVYDSLWEK